MQNRRERRRLEKQFGLMKQYQKGSKEQRAEIRARRREMGKKLHEQHLERIENAQREAEEQRTIRFVENLMKKGFTEQQAVDILDNNDRIREEREKKLAARRERQAVNAKNK